MTIQDINNERNERNIFSISNNVAGWDAVSRDGFNMITYHQGKYTFSKNDDVNRFYTERGFAKRITQLLNRGY